jgi:hypothetical protein
VVKDRRSGCRRRQLVHRLKRVLETLKKKALKQVEFILWDRVANFQEVEQRGRKYVEIKLIRTNNNLCNVGKLETYR